MRVNKTVSAVLATTFAGAVALGGVTAGTAFAADEPRPQAGQQAPAPQAQAQELEQQARALAETADVLKPVAEVVQAALNAPEGRLSEAQADRHAQAVHEALAPLVQQAAPNQSVQNKADRDAEAERTAQAAMALGNQVDELLRAAEAGDRQAVLKEAERTVQASVNLVAGASADGRLPAADMQNAPQTQASDGQVLQLPESQLPPGDPALELLPY